MRVQLDGRLQRKYTKSILFFLFLFFLNQQQTIRKRNCKMILFTRTRKTCEKHSGINLTSNLLDLHDGNYKCFINDLQKVPEKWERCTMVLAGELKALVWSSPRNKCLWTSAGFHNNQEAVGVLGRQAHSKGWGWCLEQGACCATLRTCVWMQSSQEAGYPRRHLQPQFA